jgi:hypothetical protein
MMQLHLDEISRKIVEAPMLSAPSWKLRRGRRHHIRRLANAQRSRRNDRVWRRRLPVLNADKSEEQIPC